MKTLYPPCHLRSTLLLQVDFDEFCALMLGQDVQDGQGFFNAMFKTQRETGAMFTTVRAVAKRGGAGGFVRVLRL